MNSLLNITEKNLELLDDYLDGTLSTTEKKSLNLRLETDTVLSQQLAELKTLREGVEIAGFKESLNTFHETFETNETEKSENPSSSKQRFAWIGVAATIAVIVGMFWMFSPNSNERLYEQHFSPDPGLPTLMSSTEEFSFYDGMVSYKQGNYQDAIEKWNMLLAEKPDNDTLIYFIGVAQLASSEDEKALVLLQRASENKNSTFQQDAMYYRALIQVKKGNRDEAIKLLENQSSPEAQKLLNQLNSE